MAAPTAAAGPEAAADQFSVARLAEMSDDELMRLLEQVKGNPCCPRRAFPQAPCLNAQLPIRARLHAIQGYIKSLEYNHTGTSYFKKFRDRGLKHVMVTAKEIMREALPIQCVEAVFLAVYLSNGMTELNRFPISFKSRAGGQTYRHIVLAVQLCTGGQKKWGALGISRRSTLMNKELTYSSLSSLVDEYRRAYEECFHDLVKVYVGLPFLHDTHGDGPIKWRAFKASLVDRPWANVAPDIDAFARDGPRLSEFFHKTGFLPKTKAPRGSGKGRRGLSDPRHRGANTDTAGESSSDESAHNGAADEY